MKRQTISVILTVYNEENHVGRCLQSINTQTLRPVEILVVDDGSTDATAAQVDKMHKLMPGLKFFRRKHEGVVRQCNFMAKKARGGIIVRVDGDMWFDRNYLRDIVDPIIKKKAIATFTKEEVVGNMNNVWARAWAVVDHSLDGRRQAANMPKTAWTFRAIKREAYLKVNGYTEGVGYGKDDSTLLKKLKTQAKLAPGAVCFHANPESLGEVYSSAAFMGRGDWFMEERLRFLIFFSFPSSIVKGLRKVAIYRDWRLIVFQIVYDLGLWMGIWQRWMMGRIWK